MVAKLCSWVGGDVVGTGVGTAMGTGVGLAVGTGVGLGVGLGVGSVVGLPETGSLVGDVGYGVLTKGDSVGLLPYGLD